MPDFKYLSLYYRHTTDYTGQNWACTYTSSEMFTAMDAYGAGSRARGAPERAIETTYIHR